MSFTSIAFALFVPLVFAVYWFVLGGRRRAQNVFLLAASYFFYGWWDWRFLGLIAGSTLITFLAALPSGESVRRRTCTAAIIINIGILIAFKYFNFFGDNLRELLSWFGVAVDWFTIDVLLPVGISFYTFQAVSYSVDVMRKRIKPTRDPVAFGTFIAFFPQLVAGPIERSTELLPQFERDRRWDYADSVQGVRLILWGLLKKLCLADGCALLADLVYNNAATAEPGLSTQLWAAKGVICFAMQIYGDFSGYSDIARGTAKLFGIRLMTNFLYPYFSRNPIEFWQRWHRSLMQWFTEYVYIPLGGSRHGKWKKYRNVLTVFLLSGLWHGAAWTFVVWGLWSGLSYIAAALCGARKYRPNDTAPASRRDLPAVALTFFIATLGWLFFRASDLEEGVLILSLCWQVLLAFAAVSILAGWIIARLNIRLRYVLVLLLAAIAVGSAMSPSVLTAVMNNDWVAVALLVFAVEWQGRMLQCPLERMPASKPLRRSIYVVLMFVILTGMASSSQFIYFQF